MAGRVVFERFALERELSPEATGPVWLANDQQENGNPVRLGFLEQALVQNPEASHAVRDFVSGWVDHPGIARTVGFHQSPGLAAIQTEWVDGATLRDVLEEQPDQCFDAPELLPWLEQLCALFSHLHLHAHLIHRNLAASHVVLARRQLKLIGIGAAVSQKLGLAAFDDGRPVDLGMKSPQQLAGEAPAVTDDIYALGALFYKLFTGNPPFYQGTPASIQAQVMNELAPSMSERRTQLRKLGRPPIPLEWEETIEACLAKAPESRPQSAEELLSRIKNPPVPKVAAPAPTVALPAKRPVSPAPPELVVSEQRSGAGKWALVGIAALAIGGVSILKLKPHSQPAELPVERVDPVVEVAEPAAAPEPSADELAAKVAEVAAKEAEEAKRLAEEARRKAEQAAQAQRVAAQKEADTNRRAMRKLGDESYDRGDYPSALKLYTAVTGDPWSTYRLGKIYAEGFGVPIDAQKAAAYFEQAAKQKIALAHYHLGLLYASGQGVPKDPAKASEHYRQAAPLLVANPEYVSSIYVMGVMSATGRGFAKDEKKAAELFEKAASFGDVDAQVSLAQMYLDGVGVAKDEKKAGELYAAAAAKDDVRAQSALGGMYEAGQGVTKDLKKAQELYQQALFVILHDAGKGDPLAQFNLGMIYDQGRGVPKDPVKAFELYEKAAAQGEAEALNNLGVLLIKGEGKPRDDKRALELFGQAADLGSDLARNNLAWMYESGRAGAKDEKKALSLYQQSADEGSVLAARSLARLKKTGSGERAQAPIKATVWRHRLK